MGLGVRYMNLSTDGHVATVVWLAGIGARKNGVNGAAVGQRGNARGGYEALGREHIVALVFPDASDSSVSFGPSFTCLPLFACLPGFQHLLPGLDCKINSGFPSSCVGTWVRSLS